MSKIEFLGIDDPVFKEIMSNKRVLAEYVNHICEFNITGCDIEYEPDELRCRAETKGVIFDVRIKVLNTRIELEAQNKYLSSNVLDGDSIHDRRMIHYLAMLHSENYQRGETYASEYKTIVIVFINSKLEGDAIQHIKLKNQQTNKVYKALEIIQIGLKNIENDDTIKLKLLKLLITNEVSAYLESDNIVGEVANMIYEFNSDERKLRKARMERQNELTIATIQKLAKDEGLKEGIFLVAKNMKDKNLPLEEISEMTGLSIEVIKEL